MFRIRYILIWVVVSFALLFGVSWALERETIKFEAQQVQVLTELAADSALQAGQGIDDLFSQTIADDGGWSASNNDVFFNRTDTLSLKILYPAYPTSAHYTTNRDLFQWYLNTNNVARWKAFAYLYDATGVGIKAPLSGGAASYPAQADTVSKEFQEFAKKTTKSTTYIPYYVGNVLKWIKVPRIALIGARCIWYDESDYQHDIMCYGDMAGDTDDYKYGWKALQQNGYLYAKRSGVFGEYFLTPSKVGVTYINRDLTEKIYQNNLDIIMRYKYNEDNNLTTGRGMLESAYQAQTQQVKNNIISLRNEVINNGLFTVSKETSTISAIDYAIIDVFDSTNDAMIEQLYGGWVEYLTLNNGTFVVNTQGNKVVKFKGKMTAEKLNERSTEVNPTTGTKPTNKYLVVAKVKFSCDVIPNYKTGVFTTWRTKFDDDDFDNYNNIVLNKGVSTNKLTAGTKYVYTTYWGVTA